MIVRLPTVTGKMHMTRAAMPVVVTFYCADNGSAQLTSYMKLEMVIHTIV